MDKRVSRYHKLATEYKESARILLSQIVADPTVFNPTIFLIRHTIELLLKGLIIQTVIDKDMLIDVNNIQLDDQGHSRVISRIHSLHTLWENLKNFNAEGRLIPFVDPQDQKLIESNIDYIEKRDKTSTTYRYPYELSGKPIILEPLSLDSSGKAPELGGAPPTIIIFNDSVHIIIKGKRMLFKSFELLDTVDKLFLLYHHK